MTKDYFLLLFNGKILLVVFANILGVDVNLGLKVLFFLEALAHHACKLRLHLGKIFGLLLLILHISVNGLAEATYQPNRRALKNASRISFT